MVGSDFRGRNHQIIRNVNSSSPPILLRGLPLDERCLGTLSDKGWVPGGLDTWVGTLGRTASHTCEVDEYQQPGLHLNGHGAAG